MDIGVRVYSQQIYMEGWIERRARRIDEVIGRESISVYIYVYIQCVCMYTYLHIHTYVNIYTHMKR